MLPHNLPVLLRHNQTRNSQVACLQKSSCKEGQLAHLAPRTYSSHHSRSIAACHLRVKDQAFEKYNTHSSDWKMRAETRICADFQLLHLLCAP